MKRFIILLGLAACLPALAQSGYEIRVTLKPFKNQYIYLGHYFGKQYPIVDSARLNANGQAIFKGNKKLPGGIYLVGYPNKTGFFEIILDKQQRFAVVADTSTIRKGAVFQNSPDNVLFNNYQQYMNVKGKEITELRERLTKASNAADSAAIQNKLAATDKTIRQYRNDFIKKNPDNILSILLLAMREPELPAALKAPKNRADSLAAYNFYKNHYWDDVNFWDGRLAYTPFFEEKLDKYYADIVVPHPDSVIKEIDNMLGYASINEEMNKMLLLKFVNRYLNQKYMWEDAVFVHLFEKYFAQKNYSWLTEAGRKTITDRAYSLIANLIGIPAADVELPDVNGTTKTLYSDSVSRFTLVCFWDPTCGHCKETVPVLDSLYKAKWKAMGLSIYAIAKETEGTKDDWLTFIKNNKLNDWAHVYYSKAAEKARVDAGIPGYGQLFDVQTFPTLYLLDREKRIIAKKLTWQQIDDILTMKSKTQ